MRYFHVLGAIYMLLSHLLWADVPEMAGVKIVQWNGQNSFLLHIAGKNVWVDPFNVPAQTAVKADIVFITHAHDDHLDKRSLDIVSDPSKTTVYTPDSVIDSVRAVFQGKIVPLNVGASVGIGNVSVQAAPAYNAGKKQDKHPKAKNWIGLLFSKGKESLYITGDLDRIPELKKIKADVILLPLGQTYTFDSVEDAAQAVKDVGAKIAVPVHFGMYEGTQEDVKTFEGLMKNMGVTVQVLPRKGEQ